MYPLNTKLLMASGVVPSGYAKNPGKHWAALAYLVLGMSLFSMSVVALMNIR